MFSILQPKCKHNNKIMLGLGAILMNDNKIVAFACKRLSDAKSRYANIEREQLEMIFGYERFHTYVYGK